MQKVCILGVGRQGSAAAYDILKYYKPQQLLLLDNNHDSLKRTISKVNRVKDDNTEIIAEVIDLNDSQKLIKLLTPFDIFLSAVPYQFNLQLTKVALSSKTSMVDLGGHTKNVIKQLSYDESSKNNNIAIVPDCGMGPGMNISMALLGIEYLDQAKDVYIWDGGLPKNPVKPWNYSLFFNIKGLTNEYDGSAYFIKNGKIEKILCFEEFEVVEFEDIGKLEAVVTSGGLSTMPWTFEGKLNTLSNKTLRYKGHWELMKAYRQLGLFSEKQITYNGAKFTPRDFYHFLLEPLLGSDDREDICLMRTESYGLKDGHNIGVRYEVVEEYDEDTGFMAMEKWTGWHASIVMQKILDGSIKPGAHAIEKALSGKMFYDEAVKRGYNIKETILNS